MTPAMVKGAGWSIGGTASGAVASFVVQIILARALEATRYGVYSYLLAWVNVAVLVGKLEFDTAAIRFVAAYDGQRQDGLLRAFNIREQDLFLLEHMGREFLPDCTKQCLYLR